MLTVRGGLADVERHLIRARTAEGRARAVKAGVKMGWKPKLSRTRGEEALRRVDARERLRDVAQDHDVSHSTILRLRR